jgi:hypothetical protein
LRFSVIYFNDAAGPGKMRVRLRGKANSRVGIGLSSKIKEDALKNNCRSYMSHCDNQGHENGLEMYGSGDPYDNRAGARRYYSSRMRTAAAMVVVHLPFLSPTALCVTLLVRTILFEMR